MHVAEKYVKCSTSISCKSLGNLGRRPKQRMCTMTQTIYIEILRSRFFIFDFRVHVVVQAQAVVAETYRRKYLQVVLNKCCNLKLSEFSETKPTCWPIFCEKIFFLPSALLYGGRSLPILACAKHFRFQSWFFGENQMCKCGY